MVDMYVIMLIDHTALRLPDTDTRYSCCDSIVHPIHSNTHRYRYLSIS